MVRGIDAAAAGMVSMVNLNDIIANNLANINTPGFKQTLATFKNISNLDVTNTLAVNGNNNNKAPLGKISSGSLLDSTTFDFSQGSIKITGNPLEMAINGNGFFTVKMPDGSEAYTRNGSFIRRADGVITTVEGYPLMGQSGKPVSLKKNTVVEDVKIGTDGSLELNKKIINKLKIVDFTNKKALQAVGNSLFKSVVNETPARPKNYEVKQGALEQANSNAIESMVNSINGMRTYETLAKVVETDNGNLRKAVNELGRVKR